MADSASREATASAANAAPYAAAEPEFWATIERHQYALHDVHVVTQAWVDNLRAAARDAWRIFSKIALLADALDRTALEEMGFPAGSIPLLSNRLSGMPTCFGRFDFAETTDGLRLLEFNAETPFFWLETHRINGLACAQANLDDPNAEAEAATIRAMRVIAEHFGANARVAVTASNVYREDYYTAVYLASLWQRALDRAVAVAPIHELRATEDGLNWQDERIDVLHRCYPLEYMASDSGGGFLPKLVHDERLILVNPPSALFVQNKLTQALIWGLYERGEWFDAQERKAIERIFLPTYADLPAQGTWVRKPALGREGGGIAIVDNGTTREETPAPAFAAQPVVYQRYVDAATMPVKLAGKDEEKTMVRLATCAVAIGEPTAVGLRVGPTRITDGWAYFQPVGL